MGGFTYILALACTFLVYKADAGGKTYQDMFPHKHSVSVKFPPIPGWDPDTNPWDDYLYPPFGPKDLTSRQHKPVKIRLTSDSPALSGSLVSFTAKLEYPPCQKEDARGALVWDEHCDDANGQLRSGYVFNHTSWLDDYGFGTCTDVKRCDVFPDGRPFPQTNDWRQKGYVYVFHTMGQYIEKSDGSSSTLTVNTSDISLGAELMEVMVYRKRERRKYSPLATDKNVFFVTDKIPLAVNMSQKAAANLSQNVFVRGADLVFSVQLHDPSQYLKTAAALNYIWDFQDGNQLVTHSSVATHAYSKLGTVVAKLTVEAAFPVQCPPATPTPKSATPTPTIVAPTSPPATPAITHRMDTTHAPGTTGVPTTEALPPTVADVTQGPTQDPTTAPPAPPDPPTPLAQLRRRRLATNECFRYLYGTFQGEVTIVEPEQLTNDQPASRILEVSAAKVTDTDVSFLVKCLGSTPTAVCTIMSDPACRQVRGIVCDDVPPSSACEVRLRRIFAAPGTYCVNITLGGASSLALATTVVTVGNPDIPASKTSHVAEVVLSSSAVLVAIFAFVAFMVYKRYKVYRPVRRSLVEDAGGHVGGGGHMGRLRDAWFPTNEERSRLLTDRIPL